MVKYSKYGNCKHPKNSNPNLRKNGYKLHIMKDNQNVFLSLVNLGLVYKERICTQASKFFQSKFLFQTNRKLQMFLSLFKKGGGGGGVGGGWTQNRHILNICECN